MATSKFQTKVVSQLEGKTKAAQAAEIEEVATATLEAQIAALKGSMVKKRRETAAAKTAVENAIYTTSIEVAESETYIKNIIAADEAVEKADKKEKATQALIDRLQGILDGFK